MRGAHRDTATYCIAAAGSPPHARGPLGSGFGRSPGCRITPACAGPTASVSASVVASEDHPRMRGAHFPLK